MAASHLLVCVILWTYYYYISHGGDDHGFVTVPTRSFQPEAVCSDSRVRTLEPSRATVSVPLVHRHGLCASSQDSDDPSFTERLRRSRARANYIRSRASATGGTVTTRDDDTKVTIPAHLGGAVDSLEYVVAVGLGTPSVPQTLLMDTGSDLSWVQCAPCNSTACYPQKDPLFEPAKSSTYALIPCHTDACRNLAADGTGCTSGSDTQCGFAIKYADGSHTSGVYSDETLTLAPGVTVKDFHFGCARDQDGSNDKYDGLVGLGGAPVSLVSQTSSAYGGAFSYCLPARNSEAGFLVLGGANDMSGFVFTPMSVEMQTFYVVKLTGISVAGKQLDIPPAALATSKGLIIDSGTIITELPTTAYTALRTAFRSAMSAYPLLPPNGDFDTCYNLTGFSNVTVPTVALSFDGGVTMDLDVPNGILLDGCLAFQDAGQDDPGILGNVNQRTFEVLYDVGHGKVGFRAGAC
ncbi:unnamed protein product [Urochloa decumbens]|uniref:Peptidase A1 domain-containing protein n=1 Tax=Urochloa decumbens TaxID=240449 RepID=A0ABC9E8U6_9POAL